MIDSTKTIVFQFGQDYFRRDRTGAWELRSQFNLGTGLFDALLLPFKGQIVYDGLLGLENLSFGGGMRYGFKEIYLIAKDNDAIIESLDEDAIASKPKSSKSKAKPSKDWTPLLDDLSTTAKTLRGGSGQPALYSPAFSLVRTSIELAQMATAEPPDIDKLLKKRERPDALLNQLENAALRHY